MPIWRETTIIGTKQGFFWDGNVAAMEEDGKPYYYLQDDLGSVTNLTGPDGESRERFAFDEFGLPVFHGINGKETGQGFNGMVQPFAFTGYQPDETTGLYFAQARRYDAGVGRFVSEDRVRGFIEVPFTLNHYGYCWNNPGVYVDLDGLFVQFIAGAIIGAAINVGSRIATDVITGHVSSWQEYVGDAIGGAAGGIVFAVTANPVWAGAANGAASTVVTKLAKAASGEKVTVKEVLTDTVENTAIGAGLGFLGSEKVLGKEVVEGVNAGRGSYKQITKMLTTQMRKGKLLKAKNGILGVSLKNWEKALIWQATDQNVAVSSVYGIVNDTGIASSAVNKLESKGMELFEEIGTGLFQKCPVLQ